MPADDWVKIIEATAAALAVTLGAIGALWVKIHQYQEQVSTTTGKLLDETRDAALARGKLAGPDTQADQSSGPTMPT